MASYTWLEKKYRLSPEEAAVVEWQYHYCGGFHQALWQAISLADNRNLARLERGFPIEVRGYRNYARRNGWWQSVQKKIEKA